MPDACFSEPRLAEIYDAVDGARDDLDLYESVVSELEARTVLDVGCGTGSLACRLAATGVGVIGVDPAAASLDVARTKPGAELVEWHLGDATTIDVTADLATMTGNVAMVFLTDAGWQANLRGIRRAVGGGGHVMFETRIPDHRAWEGWTRERTWQHLDVEGVGSVETWIDVTEVDLPLVSFTATYRFGSDGAMFTSDSTLRFRSRSEIESSLADCGFAVTDVRDAADRPGRQWVFIATAA